MSPTIGRQYALLTRFHSRKKILEKYSKILPKEWIDFLWSHWYSFDALEIFYSKTTNTKRLILYEVKTRNRYTNDVLNKHWKYNLFELTKNTEELYRKAKELGIDVKVAIIWLYTNWDYNIEIKNLEDFKYLIKKPRKYDNGAIF